MSRWSQSPPPGIIFPLVNLFLLAISSAFRSSLAILMIHHSLVLLWTGTSFLGYNNTLFKILFLSFSKPSIVNLKLTRLQTF